ncbi:MAG: TrmH family RNA methyltransferase [Candidatus Melainabacteria bacterium]
MTISSPQNGTIRAVSLLHTRKGRDAQEQILVEGPHAIQQAFESGLIGLQFFAAADFSSDHLPPALLMGVECAVVTEKILARLGTTDSPPTCVAVFKKPPAPAESWQTLVPVETARWVYLDGVQDPGNAGTLIRSAAAFGLSGVLLGPGSVDAWNPKVIRASAGAVFTLPVLSVTDASLDGLSDDWRLVAAVGDKNARDYRTVTHQKPWILLLGNEGAGLRERWLQHPRVNSVTIPVSRRVESLNVAVSGSILMAALCGEGLRA